MTDAQRSRSEPGRIPAPISTEIEDDGIPVDTEPDEFRSLVRGVVRTARPGQGRTRRLLQRPHRQRVDDRRNTTPVSTPRSTTRAPGNASVYDAGLAGRSWPTEYGGHGAPAWQDDVVAAEQARYGVSTKMFAVALEMLPAVLFGLRHR